MVGTGASWAPGHRDFIQAVHGASYWTHGRPPHFCDRGRHRTKQLACATPAMYEALWPSATRPPIIICREHVLDFPKKAAKVVLTQAALIVADPHYHPTAQRANFCHGPMPLTLFVHSPMASPSGTLEPWAAYFWHGDLYKAIRLLRSAARASHQALVRSNGLQVNTMRPGIFRVMGTFIYWALQPRISLIKLTGGGLTQFRAA